MAPEMETESLTVNVWYHDVKLQSSAFRAPRGGDQGWVQLTEPMPVGTTSPWRWSPATRPRPGRGSRCRCCG